jgi:hypothetical protein
MVQKLQNRPLFSSGAKQPQKIPPISSGAK